MASVKSRSVTRSVPTRVNHKQNVLQFLGKEVSSLPIVDIFKNINPTYKNLSKNTRESFMVIGQSIAPHGPI